MSQPQTIELSRKEQSRLPRNAAIEEELEKAVVAQGILYTALGTYDKELDLCVTLCGKVALSLVTEADNLLLALPARVVRGDRPVNGPGVTISEREIGAKTETGLVLTMQDRAIVAWVEGTLRLRYFAQTIPYSSVKTATHWWLSTGERYTGMAQVEAMETWTFWLRAMFKNQSFVKDLASNFLGEDVENGAPVEPATQAEK